MIQESTPVDAIDKHHVINDWFTFHKCCMCHMVSLGEEKSMSTNANVDQCQSSSNW